MSFNINNLSQENLPSKAADIGRIVGKNFQDWFSNLIVVKRAAAEVRPAPHCLGSPATLSAASKTRCLVMTCLSVLSPETCHATGPCGLERVLGRSP